MNAMVNNESVTLWDNGDIWCDIFLFIFKFTLG